MGSVVFHDSYFVSGIGSSEQNVKINFSESYSASTNKTTITFSSCQIASNLFLGNCVVRGKVQFNGSDVKTYPTSTSSYTASIGGGTSNYATVTGGSGSSITVTHNSSGAASFTIKLVALEGSYFGAAYNGKMFGVKNGSSKSYTLTTHTSSLTVNPNNGTWNGSTTTQSFSQAPTSTKTIANPTRTGYTFSGWTLSGGGSISNGVYTFGGSNGTLTAQWTADNYTVSLTAGDYIASVSGGGSKAYGSSVTVTAVLGSATGYTYTFDGWYDGTTKVSSSLSYTFTMPASSVSLTAKATRTLNSYTVSVSAGDNIASVSGGGTYPYNSNVTVTAVLGSATGYTYTFDGWYILTTKVSSSLSYSFAMPAESVSLTAVGTRTENSYTLSFDANGGTGAPEAITRTHGTTFELPATIPTKAGYRFLGWSTNSSATTPEYLPESSYTITENSTLYAVWKAEGSVHIDNGASFDVYAIYIDNGTSWDQYVPYIDNGTSWDIYS